jgi:hypothetical protein
VAYIHAGLATRLAYSIGLNVDSSHRALGFDLQEARRTWWILYIQDVELSLDAGRPMNFMDYPVEVTQTLLSGVRTNLTC